MTTVVFVHGAWHGAWAWDLVRDRLDEAGIASVALDFPMTTLDADAAILSSALDGLDDDLIVVGHSWGGSVVTIAAAERTNVRHLVYVCAFMVEAGTPVLTERRPTLGTSFDALVFDDEKAVVIPELAPGVFYNDVDPELAARSALRLRPFYRTGWLPIVTQVVAAWKTLPTTYVVCTDDQAIHPDDQREMAKEAGEVVEWPTSHAPFLSRPDLLAELLVELVARYR